MKKVILIAGLAWVLCVNGAIAQPQAKEIAYVPTCSKGVHVYDKSVDSVTCGKPAMSGSGYVIEMATDASGTVQCPKGYSYIGHVQNTHAGTGLQHFACVRN